MWLQEWYDENNLKSAESPVIPTVFWLSKTLVVLWRSWHLLLSPLPGRRWDPLLPALMQQSRGNRTQRWDKRRQYGLQNTGQMRNPRSDDPLDFWLIDAPTHPPFPDVPILPCLLKIKNGHVIINPLSTFL